MGRRQAVRHYPREWYRAPALPHGTLIDPDTGERAEVVKRISVAEIKELLRQQVVRLAIAYCPGDPVKWIPLERLYDTWKSELRDRVVPPDVATKRFHLDGFPGGYCYLASEWR